jgi:hypothetical protein
MQMVVSGNQTGGNDPTATSAVRVKRVSLSRYDCSGSGGGDEAAGIHHGAWLGGNLAVRGASALQSGGLRAFV